MAQKSLSTDNDAANAKTEGLGKDKKWRRRNSSKRKRYAKVPVMSTNLIIYTGNTSSEKRQDLKNHICSKAARVKRLGMTQSNSRA